MIIHNISAYARFFPPSERVSCGCARKTLFRRILYLLIRASSSYELLIQQLRSKVEHGYSDVFDLTQGVSSSTMKLSGNDLVTTAPPPLRSVNQDVLIGQYIGSPVGLPAVLPRGYASERLRTEFRMGLTTVYRLSIIN